MEKTMPENGNGNGSPTETQVTNRPLFKKTQDRLVIEEALRAASVGVTVTYHSLGVLLGRDVREHCRGALTGARNSLLKDDKYVFSPIPNVGLKRMNDSEIVQDSESDFAKTRRTVSRSMRKLASVEYDKLSQEDQLRHCAYATQAAVIREMSSKKATKRIAGKVEENGSQQIPVGQTLRLFS